MYKCTRMNSVHTVSVHTSAPMNTSVSLKFFKIMFRNNLMKFWLFNIKKLFLYVFINFEYMESLDNNYFKWHKTT